MHKVGLIGARHPLDGQWPHLFYSRKDPINMAVLPRSPVYIMAGAHHKGGTKKIKEKKIQYKL